MRVNLLRPTRSVDFSINSVRWGKLLPFIRLLFMVCMWNICDEQIRKWSDKWGVNLNYIIAPILFVIFAAQGNLQNLIT